MSNFEVTQEIEDAQQELDAFANELFGGYHQATEDYKYSLYTTVSREFDVAQLMTGLVIEVAPEYEYSPSPFVKQSERIDYEAAFTIASRESYWEISELSEIPEVVEEYGEEAAKNGLSILMDSAVIGDLLADYFAIEQVSFTNAKYQLSRYMELLDKADRAYRAAGWEL